MVSVVGKNFRRPRFDKRQQCSRCAERLDDPVKILPDQADARADAVLLNVYNKNGAGRAGCDEILGFFNKAQIDELAKGPGRSGRRS
jgi:hypothetical protein